MKDEPTLKDILWRLGWLEAHIVQLEEKLTEANKRQVRLERIIVKQGRRLHRREGEVRFTEEEPIEVMEEPVHRRPLERPGVKEHQEIAMEVQCPACDYQFTSRKTIGHYDVSIVSECPRCEFYFEHPVMMDVPEPRERTGGIPAPLPGWEAPIKDTPTGAATGEDEPTSAETEEEKVPERDVPVEPEVPKTPEKGEISETPMKRTPAETSTTPEPTGREDWRPLTSRAARIERPETPVSREEVKEKDRGPMEPPPEEPRPIRGGPEAPTPSEGDVTWFEIELGEKWFQRIAIVALVTAFGFLLAIIVPNLTGEQITGLVFLSALLVGVGAEYIYFRKGFKRYGTWLQLASCPIAYIATWMGAFMYAIDYLPWTSLFALAVSLNLFAAFRYRSPLLSAEAGLSFIIISVALRSAGHIPAISYAILLPLGCAVFMFIAIAEEHRLVALSMTIIFALVTFGTHGLLTPSGYYGAVPISLMIVGYLHIVGRGDIVGFLPKERRALWGAGLFLSYGVIYSNSAHAPDSLRYSVIVLLTIVHLVQQLTTVEELPDVVFIGLLGLLLLPTPYLVSWQEGMALLYPLSVLFIAISRIKPRRGWFDRPEWAVMIPFTFILAYAQWRPIDSPWITTGYLIMLTAWVIPQIRSRMRVQDHIFVILLGASSVAASYMTDGDPRVLFGYPLVVLYFASLRTGRRMLWFNRSDRIAVMVLAFVFLHLMSWPSDDPWRLLAFCLMTVAWVIPALSWKARRFDLHVVIGFGAAAVPLTLLAGPVEVSLFVYPAIVAFFALLRASRGSPWFMSVEEVAALIISFIVLHYQGVFADEGLRLISFCVLLAAWILPQVLDSARKHDLIVVSSIGAVAMPLAVVASPVSLVIFVFPAVVVLFALLRTRKGLTWFPDHFWVVAVLYAFGVMHFQMSFADEPWRIIAYGMMLAGWMLPQLRRGARGLDVYLAAALGLAAIPLTWNTEYTTHALFIFPATLGILAVLRHRAGMPWFQKRLMTPVMLLSFAAIYVGMDPVWAHWRIVVLYAMLAIWVVPQTRARVRYLDHFFLGMLAIATLPAIYFIRQYSAIAILGYPAVLIYYTARRDTRGLAWYGYVVHLSVLLAALQVMGTKDLNIVFLTWAGLIASLVLHVYLEHRSRYSYYRGDEPIVMSDRLPIELPVLLLPLAFALIGLASIDDPLVMVPYPAAFMIALFLNRRVLGTRKQEDVTIVCMTVAVIAALSGGWLGTFESMSYGGSTGLSVFHLGIMLFLAGWTMMRMKAISVEGYGGRITNALSPPTFVLLLGLASQYHTVSFAYIALPFALVVVSHRLDDAVTFIIAYFAGVFQTLYAMTLAGIEAGIIGGTLFAYTFLLFCIGGGLGLLDRRKVMGHSSQIVGTIAMFIVIAILFRDSVGTTGLWAGTAGMAVLWGLRFRFTSLRHIGNTFFIVALLKAFLYDIAGLAIIYRVLGFMVLALILLLVSYVYATYRKKQGVVDRPTGLGSLWAAGKVDDREDGRVRAPAERAPPPDVDETDEREPPAVDRTPAEEEEQYTEDAGPEGAPAVEEERHDLVWYAAYGSNLQRDRFMCYIQGGRPEGSSRTFPGSSDTGEPVLERQVIVPHELFFSADSVSWGGGGVAFIAAERSDRIETLGRIYLISVQQFEDLVAQENGVDPRGGGIDVNLDAAVYAGSSAIDGASLYDTLLFLGNVDGHPVLTFTSRQWDIVGDLNRPRNAYLYTIIRGLNETYSLGTRGIFQYLRELRGIQGKIPDVILGSLVEQALEGE